MNKITINFSKIFFYCGKFVWYPKATNGLRKFQQIEEYSAISVASEYLCAVEGDFWRRIRGKGLAYGAWIDVSQIEHGIFYFVVYKSTDPAGAVRGEKTFPVPFYEYTHTPPLSRLLIFWSSFFSLHKPPILEAFEVVDEYATGKEMIDDEFFEAAKSRYLITNDIANLYFYFFLLKEEGEL